MYMVEHLPLPQMQMKGTSTRKLVGTNDSGKDLIKLVDNAQAIFPEQSHVIRMHWSSHYSSDGSGFRSVIDHLEAAVNGKNRTPVQQTHLAEMQSFADQVWPRTP